MRFELNEKSRLSLLLLFISAVTLFRYYYILTGPLEISPDEAHYWEWSRRPDLSYYSKGPFIAYLIALSTSLMGNTEFAIRFFAPLFLALSSCFLYLLAKRLFNDTKKGIVTAVLFQVIPLFTVYGIVMTTDSPLLFFWTTSLYLFWRALNNPPSSTPGRASGPWLLLGLAIGLGLLAKYIMAFFYVCSFFFLVSSGEKRVWLKRKEPYMALAVSLLVFSPVIVWNAGHDWVILRHAAGQAHAAEGLKISVKDFLEFAGSQIGIVTPLLFFLVVYGAVRDFRSRPAENSSRLLFWFWCPVLFFYTVKSLHAKVQANWAAVSYITALMASVHYLMDEERTKRRVKTFFVAAAVICFGITAFAHYPPPAYIPVKKDPSSRLKGWKALGLKVGSVYDEMASSGSAGIFIFSDRYQVSSELAFYVPGNPVTYCVNLKRRMNQYDIWEGPDRFQGNDAIFVRIGDTSLPDEIKYSFSSCRKEPFMSMAEGRIVREYSIFRCYGFSGFPERPVQSY